MNEPIARGEELSEDGLKELHDGEAREAIGVDMTTSWHSYPKIYAIGHASVSQLFEDEVVITEKVDGSQFSFGRFRGELRCKSKGKMQDIDAPDKMFIKAIETVKRLSPKLRDGYTYRGEYLSKPKHNVLAYDREPDGNIIIFDINIGHESYLSYDDMVSEAFDLGLETVPIVFKGMVHDAEDILKMIDRSSILGKVNVEGIVVKNYHRFGRDGKVLMGKFVSERFKEIHQGEWKKKNPSGIDIVGKLIQRYKSEARWDKAVQHARENGNLADEPKDIGLLLKMISQDIHEECADEIKEVLFKWAWPKMSRSFSAGFPEWYKEKLLKLQFERGNEKDA